MRSNSEFLTFIFIFYFINVFAQDKLSTFKNLFQNIVEKSNGNATLIVKKLQQEALGWGVNFVIYTSSLLLKTI